VQLFDRATDSVALGRKLIQGGADKDPHTLIGGADHASGIGTGTGRRPPPRG
jgi:hypothetical protein